VAAWVPVLLTSVRHGVGIGGALFLDIYASSTATTLAIALGYATVLRAVGPDAIERMLSYVQMVMGFAVYGGQFLISGVLSRTAPGTWSMPSSPLIFLYPGTWFGSYLELVSGRTKRCRDRVRCCVTGGRRADGLTAWRPAVAAVLGDAWRDDRRRAVPRRSAAESAHAERSGLRAAKRAPSRCSYGVSSVTITASEWVCSDCSRSRCSTW
jgi:hypothetical protein